MTTTLCLDIGSGTQDVLLYSPDREIENCPKFVLPSPALMVGKRIARLTSAQKPIWLHGHNMGGGVSRFIRGHLKNKLPVAAQESAALTISDDLGKVSDMGIELTDNCPDGFEPILLTDFDRSWWERLLEAAGLDWPDAIAACAQDHGFHPGSSNRIGRFRLWQELLGTDGIRPSDLVFDTAPEKFTRLADLQKTIDHGPVTDTGAAAVLGALFVEEIEKESLEHGITVVNVGNSHVIAFLIFKDRILGIYEQHTGIVDSQKLWNDLALFRQGKLGFQQVFDEKGHGCATLPLPPDAGDFSSMHVIGPRREMLAGYPVSSFPAPGGDMMLAGCFGLIKGMGA